MKLIVLALLATTVCAKPQGAHEHTDDHSQHGKIGGGTHDHMNHNQAAGGMEYFNRADLNEDFQNYKVPDSAGCAKPVQDCVRGVHQHAQNCLRLWMESSLGEQIQTCETTNQEVKDADKAWQEASFKFHKALQQCLEGEAPPAEAASDINTWFLFRKKRSTDEQESQSQSQEVSDEAAAPAAAPGHEHDKHNKQYATPQECWADMRQHREECKQKVTECPKMARCNGYGDEPTDHTEAQWFNYVKRLRIDKETKVRDHRTKLHTCLQLGEDHQLWDKEN